MDADHPGVGGFKHDRSPSFIVVGPGAVKYSTAYTSTQSNKPRLSFRDFIRCGTTLTHCVIAVTPLIAVLGVIKVNSEDRASTALVCFLGILVGILIIWAGTLIVGCLIMVPVWIWRFGERLAQSRIKVTTSQERLWDQWMDGPEPS